MLRRVIFAALLVVTAVSLQSVSAFSSGISISIHNRCAKLYQQSTLMTSTTDDNQQSTPLIDLQTFLRLCDLVDSGGEAKTVIQNSQCLLNGNIETRRSKKLFAGDKVSFGNVIDLDVATQVDKMGYVFRPKKKKVKPLPKIDDDGDLEFKGRYRSEEWREERKKKKLERKVQNKKESSK